MQERDPFGDLLTRHLIDDSQLEIDGVLYEMPDGSWSWDSGDGFIWVVADERW